MAFGYRVDLAPALHQIQNVSSLTDDLKEPLEIGGNEALAMVAELFRKEGDPKWEPLAERTLMRRRNEDKESIKILQDTGQLRNSIVTPRGSPGGVYELTDTTLTIGTNLKHAATHQFGRGAIPARPYLPEVDDLIERVHAKLVRWAQDKVS